MRFSSGLGLFICIFLIQSLGIAQVQQISQPVRPHCYVGTVDFKPLPGPAPIVKTIKEEDSKLDNNKVNSEKTGNGVAPINIVKLSSARTDTPVIDKTTQPVKLEINSDLFQSTYDSLQNAFEKKSGISIPKQIITIDKDAKTFEVDTDTIKSLVEQKINKEIPGNLVKLESKKLSIDSANLQVFLDTNVAKILPVKFSLPPFMKDSEEDLDSEEEDEKSGFFSNWFSFKKKRERKQLEKEEEIKSVIDTSFIRPMWDSLSRSIGGVENEVKKEIGSLGKSFITKLQSLTDSLLKQNAAKRITFPSSTETPDEEIKEKMNLLALLEEQIREEKQKVLEERRNLISGITDTFASINKNLDTLKIIYDHKQTLVKEVYGWQMPNMKTAYKSYKYSLLSTLCYFAYEINAKTGGYNTIYDWETTDIIELAKNEGCKVVLTARTNTIPELQLFLSNTNSQETFINTILSKVVLRNADGVNINIEGLPVDFKDNYSNFIKLLHGRLKKLNKNYQLSITLPPMDYQYAYDVQTLAPYVDRFIVMGYGNSYSGSKVAGPTSPLTGGDVWGNNNIEKFVSNYMERGLAANKLILGVPYYGAAWEVYRDSFPSKVVKFLGEYSYAEIRSMFGNAKENFDKASQTPFYVYDVDMDKGKQIWFDNERSLSLKYDYVINQDLAGVAIWALGMDNGRPEFWNLLKEKFYKIALIPKDTIPLAFVESRTWFERAKQYVGSKGNRFLTILFTPENEFFPESGWFDDFLLWSMLISGLFGLVFLGVRFYRVLKNGKEAKGKKFLLVSSIVMFSILLISFLMYSRITQLLSGAMSGKFVDVLLFAGGILIGVLLAVFIIMTFIPFIMKKGELP